MSKNLLKAPYEIVQKIVTKKEICNCAYFIGTPSSLRLVKRLVASIILMIFFGIISYGIGIGIPQMIASSSSSESDVHYISVGVNETIGVIGTYFKDMILAVWCIYMLTSFLLIFPRKNFARQLFFGACTLLSLVFNMYATFIPLCFGFTYGGFGPVGFTFQFVLVCYFIFIAVRGSIFELKNELYGTLLLCQ